MLQAINQQVAIELLKKGVRTETKRHRALVNSKKDAWKARQEVSADAVRKEVVPLIPQLNSPA